MAILITNIPALALEPVMLSTSSVIEDLSRTQTENKVQDFLNKNEVKNELVKQGVSPEEATHRLASLSDRELHQLSLQIEQARYGGDILITVLLVVLIIYLMKRM